MSLHFTRAFQPALLVGLIAAVVIAAVVLVASGAGDVFELIGAPFRWF